MKKNSTVKRLIKNYLFPFKLNILVIHDVPLLCIPKIINKCVLFLKRKLGINKKYPVNIFKYLIAYLRNFTIHLLILIIN